MKTITRKVLSSSFASVSLALIAAGCARESSSNPQSGTQASASTETKQTLDPLALVLVPHAGESATDRDLRRFQERVRAGQNRDAALDRLGWLFVAKARESFDPGFYKLAEACADALQGIAPESPEAKLLRGHIFLNLHRFKEAESLARELVSNRGLPFDFALLGDALMEQGRLDEAVPLYQRMVDLRPGLQAFSRIAHLRWLKGDLDGAIEMMQSAVRASSPLDPDSAAWVNTRLATLQFQAGASEHTRQTCAAALSLRPDYPPALLLQGRLHLATQQTEDALAALRTAAHANPLPEYEWTLAEALRADGEPEQAATVEAGLNLRGAQNDPRTYSLYLATRGENVALALHLAEEELRQRQDVFTRDAYAWALAATGRLEEARTQITQALAEGTEDARLFFHAAFIASRTGHSSEATRWFTKATELLPSLLPSEQKQLLALADHFASSSAGADATDIQSANAPRSNIGL